MGISVVEVNVGTVQDPEIVEVEIYECDCQCHKAVPEVRRINAAKEPFLLRQIGEELVYPSGYRDCVHVPNHRLDDRGKRRVFCIDCAMNEDTKHIPHLQQDEKGNVLDGINRRWDKEQFSVRCPLLRDKVQEQDAKIRPERYLTPFPPLVERRSAKPIEQPLEPR